MTDHIPELIQSQLPFAEIPYGYCQCGCGRLTGIIKETDKRRGRIKGRHYRYVHGHNAFHDSERYFWEHIRVDAKTGCWLWQGDTFSTGYGRISVRDHRIGAHRFSWELHNGPTPDGLHVLHSCDVNYPPGDRTSRRCVNPAHLWLGTDMDNRSDMHEKGRNVQGERHPVAKLTEEIVKEIRQLAHAGWNPTQLARQYGVHRETIADAVKRRTWKHIP